MAHAKITLPDGISVDVTGTPDEVTAVVENLKATMPKTLPPKGEKLIRLPDLMHLLRAEKYFQAPKGLGSIQSKLAEMGHHYPVTTLSGAMQSEVRARRMRRFKEAGKYVYVPGGTL